MLCTVEKYVDQLEDSIDQLDWEEQTDRSLCYGSLYVSQPKESVATLVDVIRRSAIQHQGYWLKKLRS